MIINILKKIPVHQAALAYRDNLSILDNANLHKKNKYFLKVDLKDFFPSIKFSDLLPKLTKWHTDESPSWLLNIDAINLIKSACFFKNDSLAAGYPSSPVISNIVMFEFDTALTKLVSDKKRFGNVVYTRYADDITLSTDRVGVSGLLLKEVSSLISSSTSPKISINPEKTKIGSSSSGTASVTGMRICGPEHITINRSQKDLIRLMLSLYKKNKLIAEDNKRLLGHLAYIYHVDSAFYTKMQSKYFEEIAELRGMLKTE